MPHNRWMPEHRRVSPLRVVAALVAMIAVMLVVTGLGAWVVVPSSWVHDIDEGVVARTTDLLTGRPVLHDAAVAWSLLSGPWLVHPVVLAGVLVLLARRRVTSRALLVVVIGGCGWALGTLSKRVVERPRPAEAVVEVSSWSYPSGHATNIALGAVLVIALATTVRTAWVRRGVVVLAVVGVVVTIADRLVLGVHYPSDVLAGLLLGTGVALAGLTILRPLPSRDAPDPAKPPEAARP